MFILTFFLFFNEPDAHRLRLRKINIMRSTILNIIIIITFSHGNNQSSSYSFSSSTLLASTATKFPPVSSRHYHHHQQQQDRVTERISLSPSFSTYQPDHHRHHTAITFITAIIATSIIAALRTIHHFLGAQPPPPLPPTILQHAPRSNLPVTQIRRRASPAGTSPSPCMPVRLCHSLSRFSSTASFHADQPASVTFIHSPSSIQSKIHPHLLLSDHFPLLHPIHL